jgi:hypothetical protein
VTDVSKSVKLAGRLPGSIESNGMYSVEGALVESPKERRLAVIWYDVPKITDDVETGDRVPTIRILRIEPIGDVDEASQALQELVLQKAEARLGATPLPFGDVGPDEPHVLEDGDDDE